METRDHGLRTQELSETESTQGAYGDVAADVCGLGEVGFEFRVNMLPPYVCG
jgi:hypothetical protein